ncbi:MAG: hypothetical protein WAM09_02930 [Anaerolineales bacterium]
MDREGFRELLKTRKLSDDKIEASIAIAEQFEDYLSALGGTPDAASTWKYSTFLIREGRNTYDNLLAIGRYGLFVKNNAIYVAILELLDGAEVQPNLYQKVGMIFGDDIRDEVFAGIGISHLGVPSTEKPYDMFPVIDRLVEKVGYEQTERLLSTCLRDLPDEYFLDEREKYIKSPDIDDFLMKKHQSLVRLLQECQADGKLFFSQEITGEVVQYVEDHPETECGVREGKILYITKIPYNAKQYLTETDPTLKRYYACHCPWAREAIKKENIRLNPIFCNCSGGYSKKPWEVIFGQTLQVEVLESALKGDFRCRFAVHLPEKLEIA